MSHVIPLFVTGWSHRRRLSRTILISSPIPAVQPNTCFCPCTTQSFSVAKDTAGNTSRCILKLCLIDEVRLNEWGIAHKTEIRYARTTLSVCFISLYKNTFQIRTTHKLFSVIIISHMAGLSCSVTRMHYNNHQRDRNVYEWHNIIFFYHLLFW